MTSHCPHHIPGKSCTKAHQCPLLQYPPEGWQGCEHLTPAMLAMVRGWFEGAAPEREEAQN